MQAKAVRRVSTLLRVVVQSRHLEDGGRTSDIGEEATSEKAQYSIRSWDVASLKLRPNESLSLLGINKTDLEGSSGGKRRVQVVAQNEQAEEHHEPSFLCGMVPLWWSHTQSSEDLSTEEHDRETGHLNSGDDVPQHSFERRSGMVLPNDIQFRKLRIDRLLQLPEMATVRSRCTERHLDSVSHKLRMAFSPNVKFIRIEDSSSSRDCFVFILLLFLMRSPYGLNFFWKFLLFWLVLVLSIHVRWKLLGVDPPLR
jgi:hypothetical protein